MLDQQTEEIQSIQVLRNNSELNMSAHDYNINVATSLGTLINAEALFERF